jgi:hypothetical protein
MSYMEKRLDSGALFFSDLSTLRPLLTLADGRLDGSNNGHQDAASDTTRGDAADDASDVESGGVATKAKQPEDLPPESTSENPGNRVADRSQADLLGEASGEVTADGTAD